MYPTMVPVTANRFACASSTTRDLYYVSTYSGPRTSMRMSSTTAQAVLDCLPLDGCRSVGEGELEDRICVCMG